MKIQQASLFDNDTTPWHHLLPKKVSVAGQTVSTVVWDVPYTIPQLSYATHGHFRYYGKFPSSVAAQILEDNPAPNRNAYVLDNFGGSGTTLVEARLRGIRSVGLDVSWLATFSMQVKTSFVDLDEVTRLSQKLGQFEPEHTHEQDKFLNKWFAPKVAADLFGLRNALIDLPASPERDFLVLAFLAIIRRVSRAHDGEVRPHIRKDKAERSVCDAYQKKVRDMAKGHADFMRHASVEADVRVAISDNTRLGADYDDGNCYLVISHPPYLNSFDYSPVYNLEYWWGAPFEPVGFGKKAAQGSELKAYPASDKITDAYYAHLSQCYSETYRIQKPGGRLAIVIGDCTRSGKLEPVIEKTIELVEHLGYRLVERAYRTTHYGLGKYAYDFRADYHGEAVKRDGTFLFEKL